MVVRRRGVHAEYTQWCAYKTCQIYFGRLEYEPGFFSLSIFLSFVVAASAAAGGGGDGDGAAAAECMPIFAVALPMLSIGIKYQ